MSDIAVTVDPRVYRLSAVKKAAYRLGGRCFAKIELTPEGGIQVTLTAKPGGGSPSTLEGEFRNELLDQELREAIAEETGRVRNLLLAQAFSGLTPNETDTVDYREDPLGIGRSQDEGH